MLTDRQILRVLSAELGDLHGEEPFEPGQHAVRARVSLTLAGSVEQLPNQFVTPTVRIPLLSVLAMVCERSGVSAERMADRLVEAAVEAFTRGEPVGDYVEHTKAAERKARELILARMDRVERRGALRRIVAVEDLAVEAATLSGRSAAPAAARRRAPGRR